MRPMCTVPCMIAVLVLAGAAIAQEEGPSIEAMVFCTAVEEMEPVGAGIEFPDTVAVVFCFTKIAGAADTTIVSHVWYYGGEEMARVTLPVKSASWRTWSSKLILPEWRGTWRVDVLSEEGAVLESGEFSIVSTE